MGRGGGLGNTLDLIDLKEGARCTRGMGQATASSVDGATHCACTRTCVDV